MRRRRDGLREGLALLAFAAGMALDAGLDTLARPWLRWDARRRTRQRLATVARMREFL